MNSVKPARKFYLPSQCLLIQN